MNANPVTILLIEDDPAPPRFIETTRPRAGANNPLGPLTPATAALEHLFGTSEDGRRKVQLPTLVLLDLNLPDMSGTDILARIKADELLRRAPVIVLTTTDDKLEIQRCYDLGCNVYITKPVEYESFAVAIRQLGLFLAVMQVPEAD